MGWWEWFRKQVSPEGAWANAVALLTAALVATAGVIRLAWPGGRAPSSVWSWLWSSAWFSDKAVFDVVPLGVLTFGLTLGLPVKLTVVAVLLILLAVRFRWAWIIGAAVVLLVALGCWVLWTRTESSAVLWLIVASVAAAALLSHYFTRRPLLVFVAIMGLLVLIGTVRVGQRTTDDDRVTAAKSDLLELMGERCRLSIQARQTDADGEAKADPPHLVSAGQWIWSSWPGIVEPPEGEPDPEPVREAKDELDCDRLVLDVADEVKPNQDDDFERPGDWTGTAHDQTSRGLAQILAGARLAMATARLAAAEDDAKDAATTDVELKRQELADAVSANGLDASPTSLLDLLSTGADAVVGSLPVFGSINAPVELTVIGWVVIGGLGLIVLRRLVIHSARRGMGPVTIECSDETKEATVGAYVVRNLPEPGTVPNSSSLSPITDLAAGFAPAASWVGKVADAIVNVVNVPSGYTATFTALDAAGSSTTPPKIAATVKTATDSATPAADAEPAASLAPAVSVAVVVSDVRTRQVYNQTVIRAKEGGDLWQSASYWAAAVVLDRALDVPPWGHWRPEASRALASYAEEIRRYERDDTEGGTVELLAALRDAPDNGLVLMSGASTFNLKDDPVASFNLALQAAHHHPDYLLARYRLSIQASALAAQIDQWGLAPAGDQLKICTVLRRPDRDGDLAKLARSLATALETGTKHDRQVALIKFGRGHAAAMRDHLNLMNLVPGLLSRTERRTTRHLLMWDTQRLTGRRRLCDLARSVILISDVRLDLLRREAGLMPSARKRHKLTEDEREVCQRADAFASGWQLAYNIACLWAIRAGAVADPAAAAENAAEEAKAAGADDSTAVAAGDAAAASAAEVSAAVADAAVGRRTKDSDATEATVRADPAKTCKDLAFSYIWKALERPGSSMLTTRWVEHDPDLQSLKADERWDQLLDRLKGNES